MDVSVGRDPDFRRLWAGAAVSQLGSAIGSVALPLIALETLGAENSAVSLLALLSAASVLVTALPAGAFAEVRRKRPVMMGADLARAAVLAGIPILYSLDHLSVVYLCVVAVVNGAANVTFSSASQAHLRDLVDDSAFTDANGKLMSTLWLGLILGPSLAGLMLTAMSPVWLCAIDAASFVCGLAFIAALRRPESAPTATAATVRERWDLVTGGVRLVWNDPRLRALLLSWTAFAGLASAFSPVSQVFYLRELHFTPTQYGLILGLPSLGGFVGAWVTRHGAQRIGLDRTLRIASWARSVLYLAFPLLIGGTLGVVIAMILFGLALFTTSLANSSMGAIRVKATPLSHNARVSALWTFAGMSAGPVLIAATTPLLQTFGPRAVLAGICIAIALTPLLLPRPTREDDAARTGHA